MYLPCKKYRSDLLDLYFYMVNKYFETVISCIGPEEDQCYFLWLIQTYHIVGSVCRCFCYVLGVQAAQSWCAVRGMAQWLILSSHLMRSANRWLWKKRCKSLKYILFKFKIFFCSCFQYLIFLMTMENMEFLSPYRLTFCSLKHSLHSDVI